MSGRDCGQFVAHARKPDVCSSCLKPRSQHVNTTTCTSPSSPASVQKNTDSHPPGSPSSSSAKPSPIKPKPAISTKPEKPKKPCATGDQSSATKPDIKKSEESISDRHGAPSKLKNLVDERSGVKVGKELINSSGDSPRVVAIMETNAADEKEVRADEKTSHYYIYDVTASGLSGKPAELEVDGKKNVEDNNVVGQNTEAEHRKFKTLPPPAMRHKDDVAEEHVAMPYNVVDVTLLRPRTPNVSTDSPSAEFQPNSSSPGTWPNKPQPAKRTVVPSPPKPRERVTRPKDSDPNHQETDGGIEPHAGGKVLPSNLVSERYAHRIYEDIDDCLAQDVTSKSNPAPNTDLIRQTPARSSAGKSPAFEAKMAALASLDLGKTANQLGPGTAVANPSQESTVITVEQTAGAVSSVQDPVVVSPAKQEKSRKNGGKTFFKKFLKFGSKDTPSEATRNSTLGKSSESGKSTELGQKVVQCPGSPGGGKESAPEDVPVASDATPVPSQVSSLSEKQLMMMNLKDCLAKRQTSPPVEVTQGSPVHLRTGSAETSIPVQRAVPPAGSMQQQHGNTVAETKQHPSIIQDTAPVADNRAVSASAQVQTMVKDATVSPPCSAGSHKTDKCDKKVVEVPKLEIKDLTVVTDEVGNVDCSVSTCSSDAISPTPSDLSMDTSDLQSLKRKQGRRRMMEAPPPPPVSAAVTQNIDTTPALGRTRHSSCTGDSMEQPPAGIVRHVSVPCDGSLAAGETLSHSLPRPTPKAMNKQSSDTVEPVKQRTDASAQRASDKTSPEGRKIDPEQSSEESTDNRTDEQRIAELGDKRASKFLNRALPEPPSSSQTNTEAQTGSCPEELSNLYELISQSTPEDDRPAVTAGETYEDIDNCLDRSDAGAVPVLCNDSLSSHHSSASRNSSMQPFGQNPLDEEYLEPVIPAEEEIRSSNWRPSPAPRTSISVSPQPSSYVNVAAILPTVADGFTAMTEICLEALKQIAERMVSQYVSASWPTSCCLEWSDFELIDGGQPYVAQQHLGYYRARHATLAPRGCVLMAFKTWPKQSLLVQQHPHVLSPVATFCAPHLTSGTRTNVDNVAVLSPPVVTDFAQYWHDRCSSSDSSRLEHSACLTLARLLSAALYLRGRDVETPRLLPRRVVMATLDNSECYPLLRPSTRPSNVDSSVPVADDVAEIISTMLQLDEVTDFQRSKSGGSGKREKPIDVVLAFSPQSSYFRCFQRVVRCLQQKSGALWEEGVRESLHLLEFTLWGPSDDEARMIAVSEGRDLALKVWLSVTRCRTLAELALVDGFAENALEMAQRATFLCSATETSILEATKLLFT